MAMVVVTGVEGGSLIVLMISLLWTSATTSLVRLEDRLCLVSRCCPIVSDLRKQVLKCVP